MNIQLNGHGIAGAIQGVLDHFEAVAKHQPDLNRVVTLKGKIKERDGDNIIVALLHPDGTETGEVVTMDSWELSLLQKEGDL